MGQTDEIRRHPLTEEVRKGGVSINPVVHGWLTGNIKNPQVTFDPSQSQTVRPIVDTSGSGGSQPKPTAQPGPDVR